MNEVRQTSSIAGRITRHFVWKHFRGAISLFLTLFLFFSIFFLYHQEKILAGDQWTIKMGRYFESSKDPNLSFYKRLGTASYTFVVPAKEVKDDKKENSEEAADSSEANNSLESSGDQERTPAPTSHTIPLGSYAQGTYVSFWVFLALQIFPLIRYYIQGKDKTKELLAPLQQMAETAHELSQANFDEEKYHNLESAIDQISALSPDSKLRTGDKELAGLEIAINKLITRMHESYMQQARFVSDASHELRTPIAVIQGYADLLARWGKEDEAVMQESIDAIQGESRQMKILVDQLLFLARGDSGRNQMKKQPLNLASLVQEIADEYSMIETEHQWKVETEEDVLVFADFNLLKQAIRILCDNAVKYSPPESEIKLRAYRNAKGESCIDVQDQGEGISQEDASRIFDRFYRADPARSREKGGTGLGLSISKWIVDQHKGYFHLISSLGIGSRFTICLPSYKEHPALEDGSSATKESSNKGSPNSEKKASSMVGSKEVGPASLNEASPKQSQKEEDLIN